MNESTSSGHGIIGVTQALGQNPEASDRKRLIGAWKLASFDVSADGNVLRPYGEHPIGRLTYDAAGRMSAHVMRPGRESSVHDPGAVATASYEELRQIADGYVGYCGTFTLDEESNTVIHHVESCTLPAWVGTDQARQYEFVGGHLVLRAGSAKLVWERLPD
jgi:YD repeat-containing protein